jgi:alpha-glucan,water dikinase
VLSFTCKQGGDNPLLCSLLSKSVSLLRSRLIFRSDSNKEILADFSGSGLYDSIMLQQPQKVFLDFSETPLFIDDNFRAHLLDDIAAMGAYAEDLLGVFPDIEGAYCRGKYPMAQTRSQVGLVNG